MKTTGLQGSYDSIAQGAAALGCTKGELRKWKKRGAAGFRGSRFYPAEFLAWLKKEEAAAKVPDATNGVVRAVHEGAIDKEGLECRRIRLQCETIELQNAEKRRELLAAGMVATSWIYHTRRASLVMDAMVTTLAPTLAGRSAREIEEMLREKVEVAKAELRARPYGNEPACCQACGEKIELFLEPVAVKAVAPAVVAKGKTKKGKKK